MPVDHNRDHLAVITCPFFVRESSICHNIVCEGPDFWSTVSLNYGNNEKARKRHLEAFCCTMRYKQCRVCRLISNAKYEEDCV